MANSNLLYQGRYRRLKTLLAPVGPIPMSRSSWLAGVKEGRYPAPISFGPRIRAWDMDDIEQFLKQSSAAGGGVASTHRKGDAL